jgi:hypothetical protein
VSGDSAANAPGSMWRRAIRALRPSRRAGAGRSDEAPRQERPRPPAGGPSRPVCQIRWVRGRRGSSFCAALRDTDGIERAVAWSPSFGWRDRVPPEQSVEAEAALRQLAEELRASGWTPLRAKGKDFDAEQWYARRFRLPAS